MTLLLSLLFACQGDTESGFSTYGNNTIDTDALNESTGSGNAEDSSNNVNPVISGMDGYFVADANGIALEMHIYVTDPQDDLLNGMLEVDYQWEESSESTEMDIDGDTVLVEEGELTFFIVNIEETTTYDVSVTVYDEASNPSQVYSSQVLPPE